MYTTPDRLPAVLTVDEMIAGLRRLALDAGDEAHKIGAGPFAVQRRYDSRLLNRAADALADLDAAVTAYRTEADDEGA
jgi:hypothetical protein